MTNISEQIVRDLAASDWRTVEGFCVLCGRRVSSKEALDEHMPDCLWRRAAETNGRTESMIEQLQQLCTVTWDGNLISKAHRDRLVESGYASRTNGYNFITQNGLIVLDNLNLLPKGVRK